MDQNLAGENNNADQKTKLIFVSESKENSEDFFNGLSREKWLDQHDKIQKLSWLDAQEKTSKMNLEGELTLPREISGLHFRTNQQYTQTFDNLQSEFGEQLPALFAYAQWVKWVSCWDGAYWFIHSIEHGKINDNDYTRTFCTAAGYASNEGWTYTAYSKLSALRCQPLFQDQSSRLGLGKTPSDSQTLDAMELHWLWLASDSNPTKLELLEFLHEASEASQLSNGLSMWDGAQECLLVEMETDPDSKAALSARRQLAQSAARAKHAPNRVKREQVIARYKAEKDNFTSKDAAAIAFTKDFPFEFSTIRDWLKGV